MDELRTWGAYWPQFPALRARLLQCVGAGELFENRVGPRERVLPTHQLVFVSRGTGVAIDPRSGNEWPVEAPAVLWQFPGVPHSYFPSRTGWDEHWVLFGGASASVVEDLSAASPARPVVPLLYWPRRVDDLFATLHELHGAAGRRALFRAAIAVQELVLEAVAASTAEDGDLDILQRFVAGWSDRLSMAQRARRLGVSVRTLRKIVAAETGQSPIDLLTETRLAHARSMLVETSLDVATIAREVGFDDPAFFSRQFSRKVGIPPSTFRADRRDLDLRGNIEEGPR
jgi:AraC-like DNA-binding protein